MIQPKIIWLFRPVENYKWSIPLLKATSHKNMVSEGFQSHSHVIGSYM